ncbi:MAG: DNA repair protein RecN, partial [Clostridiales bacterium]
SGELQKLAMPQALFRIDLPPTEISPRGQEKALFMICSNTGEDFKPVTKIASGGELSRIILGMKVILSQLDKVPTLIFDEVDVGLSGRALSSVAERLKAVGENAQTIVVSHAAVMAAAADHQINISKKVEAGRTIIFASTLTGTKRETELARMIAGNNVTATTLQQAKEMLATWQPE